MNNVSQERRKEGIIAKQWNHSCEWEWTPFSFSMLELRHFEKVSERDVSGRSDRRLGRIGGELGDLGDPSFNDHIVRTN